MTSHGSSATVREATPHVNQISRTTISDALRARTQLVTNDFSHTNEINNDDSREKIEALAEIICGASDQSAAALFVLMGRLQNSTHPKERANTVKHLAFTRCGEFNFRGIVDAQVAIVESELLEDTSGAD